MSNTDPMRRRRAALAAAAAEQELPAEYYERAVDELMKDESEQRDFVHSEFMPLDLVRRMISGELEPSQVRSWTRGHFRTWLNVHRKFRVTTMAWALYAKDHPEARRD